MSTTPTPKPVPEFDFDDALPTPARISLPPTPPMVPVLPITPTVAHVPMKPPGDDDDDDDFDDDDENMDDYIQGSEGNYVYQNYDDGNDFDDDDDVDLDFNNDDNDPSKYHDSTIHDNDPMQNIIDSDDDSDTDESKPDNFAVPELPPPFIEQFDLLIESSVLAPAKDRAGVEVSDSDNEQVAAPIKIDFSPFPARVVPPIPLGSQSSFRGLARRRRDTELIANEAQKVFSVLDEDGDGFISDAELIRHLGISRIEARAIIDEVEQSLHGKLQDGRLNVDEFAMILENSVKETKKRAIPEKQQQRYRKIFDQMDSDGNGVVTTEEFAQGLKIDTADLGLDSLTFEQFVEVMSRAEQSSAQRTLAQLLSENEKFPELARALSKVGKKAKMKRSPREVDWAIDPPSMVKQLWENVATLNGSQRLSGPQDMSSPTDPLFTSGRAELVQIQQALQTALQQGTLLCDDDGVILQIVLELEQSASTSRQSTAVSFADFAKVMQSALSTNMDNLAPLTARSDMSSYTGSQVSNDNYTERSQQQSPEFSQNVTSAYAQVQSASASKLLQSTTPGLHASVKKAFDEKDTNLDGLLSREEAIDVIRELSDYGVLDFTDDNEIEFAVLQVMEDEDVDGVTFDMFVQLIQDYS